MRTLKHRCEPSAARDGLLRFAQPMATLRSPSPQRPSGSTSWIFWEHSDEMTGNILARQWHPRLGTSTDEAIRILILIVAPQALARARAHATLMPLLRRSRVSSCVAYARAAASIPMRQPGVIFAQPLRMLRLLPAGAVAGWGLHPLESVAFTAQVAIP